MLLITKTSYKMLTTPKTTNNVPIHLPSNQSVAEGGTKEEKIWKRDRS